MHPVYREHDSLKSNSVEHELDRVRLDMKGMLASLENKALNARPKKKRRAVLFPDSDDDLDQETSQILPQLLMKSMLI